MRLLTYVLTSRLVILRSPLEADERRPSAKSNKRRASRIVKLALFSLVIVVKSGLTGYSLNKLMDNTVKAPCTISRSPFPIPSMYSFGIDKGSPNLLIFNLRSNASSLERGEPEVYLVKASLTDLQ